jgi:hypothetical protein
VVAAARGAGGPRAAEEVDYAVRLAFFRDSADVSIEHGLRHALAIASRHAAVDADEVLDVWHRQPVRADVLADYRTSRTLPIQGSPQVFLPDGRTFHHPGLTAHDWERGIPRIRHSDRDFPAEIVRMLT